MVKRYAVDLITGYVGGYCDFSTVYQSHLFDTLEEANDFYNKHFPNCTKVIDTENLPF